MTDLAEIRYQLIKPLLSRYRRRFSVLDLGAGINPYLAQRISNEFDCVYTLIEQDEIAADELAKLGPRAMWLRKKMSAEDLKKLCGCENFDVVIAFNFLHHFEPADSLKALMWIESLGSSIFIQMPSNEDSTSCGQRTIPIGNERITGSLMYKQIGATVQFEGHMARPVFASQCQTAEDHLSESSWTSPYDCIDAKIISTYEERTIQLAHKGFQPRPYIHGLNLWNFAQLNGQWPRKEAVLKLIRDFPVPGNHGDVVPHNFLFDGQALHLIDGHEGWEFDDKAGLEKTAEMVEKVLQ